MTSPDSVGEQMDRIRLYLRDEYQLDLIDDRYADPLGVADKIDGTVDMVLIDRKLEDIDGTETVEEIRSRYNLLDIMLYTRGAFDYTKIAEITRHRIVEIAPTGEFVDKAKTLIDRNLSRWLDIFFLRGSVISKVVDVEVEINDLILEYFSPRNDTEFRNFVLENKFSR